MRKAVKGVMSRVVSAVLTMLIVIPVLFTTTGCGDVDNSAVNTAIANSSVTSEIAKKFSKDAADIRLLWDMGIIDDATYYTASGFLMTQAGATVGTVRQGFSGTLGLSAGPAGEDPEATATVAESAVNPFVENVLRAMTRLADFPYDECNEGVHQTYGKKITDWGTKASEYAADHVGGHQHDTPHGDEPCDCYLDTWASTFLPAYSGYNTRHLIEVTDYAPVFGGLKNKDEKDASELFRFWGDGSALQGVVDCYNNLGDISVYVLDPGYAVTNQQRLHELPTLLRNAASRKDASELLGSWYRTTPIITGYKPPGWKELSGVDAIYVDGSLSCYNAQDGSFEATIKVKWLQIDAILNAIKADISTVFEGAVLIGNKLFITHYDVAVLEGFYKVENTDATAPPAYMAAFQHPSVINGVSGSTAYAVFSETTDPATGNITRTLVTPAKYGSSTGSIIKDANFPATNGTFQTRKTSVVESSGDTPFIETFTSGTKTSTDVLKESIIIDVFDGKLIRKVNGEAGASHSFMGFGDGTVLPSLAVAQAGSFKRVKLGDPLTVTNLISPLGTGDVFKAEALWCDPAGRNTSTWTKTYEQPMFVLAEYLELLYSPGIVGDEPLVAYGRKVRLDDEVVFSTTQPIPISQGRPPAYIVGSGITEDEWRGRETRNPLSVLSLADFADVDGYFADDGTKKLQEQNDGAVDHVASIHMIAGGFVGGELLSGDASEERSDRLPQFVSRFGIETVMVFGSADKILASADAGRTPTQTPLFGVVLHGNLYERGMFSDWINATGSAGLENWDSTTDNLGYPNYKISNAVLTEKLRGNYAFELNNDGLLSLDLDTIVEINRQGVEDRRGAGVMVLRTILMVMGFLMLAYVSVLLASWALDVNMDLGMNVLEKVTFGHFVAVRSLDEMPEPDPESSTTYVDFRRVVARSIVFACVGIVLLTLDPVGLVIRLMEGLNFLINEISRIIFGTTIV